VPELEFRVYKVRDAEKFFAGLKDLHSFGVQSYSPAEQIDQRTWIERLHDFKAISGGCMRHFFRGQFTDEARDSFREGQGKLGKRSQVVGAAEFAQIPAAEREPAGGALEAGDAARPWSARRSSCPSTD
jgi:alpha-2-macroglobulin